MGLDFDHWVFNSIKEIEEAYVPHKYWEYAYDKTLAHILTCPPGEVVLITGPSSVGKSKILDLIFEKIKEANKSDEIKRPVVKVVATNRGEAGTFSNRSIIEKTLDELDHPIYGMKSKGTSYEEIKATLKSDSVSGIKLERALERYIELVDLKYFGLDEAQHLIYIKGGRKGARLMLEKFKGMAVDRGFVLVLVGAYPLLDVIKLCPHLIARKHEVHFPRYRVSEEDLSTFAQILLAYSTFVKLKPNVSSLVEYIVELHQGSLGCIGLLKRWLCDGLVETAVLKKEYLDLDILMKVLKSYEDIDEIYQEIKAGEKKIYGKKYITSLETDKGEYKTVINKIIKKHKPFTSKPRRYPGGGRE